MKFGFLPDINTGKTLSKEEKGYAYMLMKKEVYKYIPEMLKKSRNKTKEECEWFCQNGLVKIEYEACEDKKYDRIYLMVEKEAAEKFKIELLYISYFKCGESLEDDRCYTFALSAERIAKSNNYSFEKFKKEGIIPILGPIW